MKNLLTNKFTWIIVAIITIAYFTRKKWMPYFTNNVELDTTSTERSLTKPSPNCIKQMQEVVGLNYLQSKRVCSVADNISQTGE